MWLSSEYFIVKFDEVYFVSGEKSRMYGLQFKNNNRAVFTYRSPINWDRVNNDNSCRVLKELLLLLIPRIIDYMGRYKTISIDDLNRQFKKDFSARIETEEIKYYGY